MPSGSPKESISRRWVAVCALLALGVIVSVIFVAGPSAPRRTGDVASTPSQPAAARPIYVADSQCVACHDEIYAAFSQHPMGRSLAPTAVETTIDGVIAQFEDGQFRYDVKAIDEQVVHSETRIAGDGSDIASTALPVSYTVGSGQRGQSFLVQRGDHLFLSPITWYPQHSRWDLSPGYETRNSHFNRPVIEQCLFCHSNRAHAMDGTLNKYQSTIFSGHSIGCQRCHGPGDLHIRLHRADDASEDLAESIINPDKLDSVARESVCQQCHLSGDVQVVRHGKDRFDFRPGMRLDEVIRVFVSDSDSVEFVGHVEQMHASLCYQRSGGQMNCTSCHDPHQVPVAERRVEFYRTRCMACHQEQGCSESHEARQLRGNDCTSCHMPPLRTEIRHAATTDHRVLRIATALASDESIASQQSPLLQLKPFHQPVSGDVSLTRDAALAALRAADRLTNDVAVDQLRRIQRDLVAAVRSHSDDWDAHEGLALTNWRMGNLPRAMSQFEYVVNQLPNREFSLNNAATIATAIRQNTLALQYWQRSVQLNPWMVRTRVEFARALARSGQWQRCNELCTQTIELFPNSNRARQMLVESYLALHQPEKAADSLQTWLQFEPTDPDQLRQWFDEHPLRGSNP